MKIDVFERVVMSADVFDVLSDDALLERVEELTRKERRVTFNVVMHLGEVERRRIYLYRGFGSMFDYCTRGLGYSESAAYRRIATCRCIRKFARVMESLQQGDLTITTVAMISGVIRRDNLGALLRAVSGKSQSDVKKIVAGYKTGKPFRDRIRPIVIERPAIPLAMETPVCGESAPGKMETSVRGGIETSIGDETIPGVGKHAADAMVENSRTNAPDATGEGSRGIVSDSTAESSRANAAKVGENHLRYEGKNDPMSRRETYYEFTIAADEEFMQMYRRVRSLQSIKATPGADIAATFKALMREHIARHAPEEKQKRRVKRKEAKERQESACWKLGCETSDRETPKRDAPTPARHEEKRPC